MNAEMPRPRSTRRVAALLLLSLLPVAVSTGAQEPPPSLPVAEAEGFLGDWQLEVDFQGQQIEMAMTMADEDGFVAATVASPQGTQRITDIERTEAGLDLAFTSQVGAIHLELALDGEGLVGKLATETGGFEAKLRGVRGEVDLEELAAGGGLFGSPPPESTLELAGGRVSLQLPRERVSRAELMAGPNGSRLLVLPDSAAVKLRTTVDLTFEQERIPGQRTEGYPGVYSLWIENSGEGWRLLINAEADIWGTQRDAEHDLVRLPLAHSESASDDDRLVLALEPTEGGGLFRATWRGHEWTAAFAPAP